MFVRRLWIDNFRGIKHLDWKIPEGQHATVLVGPGDAGKTTILEAIHLLLSDRWMIPFADTDFYGVVLDNQISIRAAMTDIPTALMKDNAFGMWLSGIDEAGDLHDDPEDVFTPALLVQLKVDMSLEPKWTVARVNGEQTNITASQRRNLSTFKVDDRTDSQLRWSRTSALGRLSSEDGAERQALAEAARAAQNAIAGGENVSLNELTRRIQERANQVGGGSFSDIRPGLDTSRSSLGAALALYEGVVPLTSYGLGSRRLASLAVQQLAAGDRAVAVIDEIEAGLEPHRAIRLLAYLLSSNEYSQIVFTTHSPVLVEQAKLENLAAVSNREGEVTVAMLGGADEEMQRLRRTRPSSLLARRAVVVEGKTEHGLLLECIDAWDEERVGEGLSTAAGEGTAVVDGGGGREAISKAQALLALGLEVASFIDNDDRSVDDNAEQAKSSGVLVTRWAEGNNTERQICAQMNETMLTRLVAVGSIQRSGDETVLQDLNLDRFGTKVTSLDVGAWISDGMSLTDARTRVAVAAHDRKWFRTVDSGRALGAFVLGEYENPEIAQFVMRLNQVKRFIYGIQEGASQAARAGDP